MSMIASLYRITETDLDRLDNDDPDQIWELLGKIDPPPLSLEKDWHAIHTLLVGAGGDDASPAGFLLNGGQELKTEGSYGPPRVFNAAEVRLIDQFLKDLSDDRFWSTFNEERFKDERVYPRIWDEPEDDLRAALVATFHAMRDFISEAAVSGDSLIFDMT